MGLQNKSSAKSASIDVDLPDAPQLFQREPDRQRMFEEWYASYNRSLLLKLEQITKSLDSKKDKE